MKFISSKELNTYLDELENTYQLNLSISDLLFSIMGNRDITSKEEIDALKKSSGYSDKDLLLSRVIDYLDIDLSIEDNQDIFDNYIAKAIKEVDIIKYLSNPYYHTIKINNVKDGDLQLVDDHYEAYELFPYLDMSSDTHYIENNSLGYFNKNFHFIALNHKGVTWMSITPNEIETMEASINKVRGTVTVFGLGLGYFAFMASNKKEVDKVIIIEKDKKNINLFNKYLRPQFPNANKIVIAEDDALNFLNKDLESDFAFIDLWHDPTDGIELFLKFKQAELKQSKCHFLYWLESSFYLYLRRCFMSLIFESKEGYGDAHYKNSKNIDDRIINKYYFATKNLVISSKADLDKLLSDKSLLELLLNH